MALKFELSAKSMDSRFARAMKGLRSFGSMGVSIGFLQGVSQNRRKEPLTNALLGYVHENGSEVAGIPARPFLVPAMKRNRREVTECLEKGLQEASDGDLFALPTALSTIGTLVRDAAKENIVGSVGMAPLNEDTLKARKRAGFAGTKPLVMTAQLLNAIHFRVR